MSTGWKRRIALLITLALVVIAALSITSILVPKPRPFDYIVVILMEGNSGGVGGPYMNQLASEYSSLSNYTGIANPSLPNYLGLLGGSTFGCSGYDGLPDSNACTRSAWVSQNLVDRLESAGLTWKAYMESMTTDCQRTGATRDGYYARHDPFVYFNDIVSDPARCARIVPVTPGASLLISDLQSTSTASNFMWLSPNGYDDMHDSPTAVGDSYLSKLVPQILSSYIFTTQRAALFITFDNPYSLPFGLVYAAWAGPVVKTHYQSSASYNHYSFLKTLEVAWGLSYLSSNDNTASPMIEFFTTI